MLRHDLPAVLDADALNLLARRPVRRDDWILTPHPGEAGRLLGQSSVAVQGDRLRALVAENAVDIVTLEEDAEQDACEVQADDWTLFIEGWPVSQVTCVGAGFCLALGDGPIGLRWDGTGWHRIEVTGMQYVIDVACSGPTHCVAAHDGGVSAWDGTAWTALNSIARALTRRTDPRVKLH